ncbi:MAG TPA: class IV adenylate cyclase [Vicinamibacterales bacterium]|nr:class IV adenylate cyclase [Vicinamibacterales bacterium]
MTQPLDGIEREIKLRFGEAGLAREAILGVGATPSRGRRLQEDFLLDADDNRLQDRQSVLRVRTEQGRSLLTFKGPVQPSPMKLREERETVAADGETLLYILEQLGFHVWFRYQKYREEFGWKDAVIALDETPIGVFVEIEGSEQTIVEAASALGRSATDYITDSYRALYLRDCKSRGVERGDMVFDED